MPATSPRLALPYIQPAQAQKHVGQRVGDGHVVSDIAKGEESITHRGGPIAGGPAAMAQSIAAQARNEVLLDIGLPALYEKKKPLS